MNKDQNCHLIDLSLFSTFNQQITEWMRNFATHLVNPDHPEQFSENKKWKLYNLIFD